MMALVDFAIRSSVVLALGLLLTACLGRRSAALRHRVLTATLVVAVAVVPLGYVLPDWSVPLPVRAVTIDDVPEPDDAMVAPVSPSRSVNAVGDAGAAPIAAIVWLAGVGVAIGVLGTGLLRVRRLAHRASRMVDERWLTLLIEIAAGYGVRRDVALLRTDSAHLLATWGFARPQVLLPRDAHTWHHDRVRTVLSHELAHVRRFDWPVQMLAEVVRAILWFNPLVWIACRRLRHESEQSCDDEVLRTGVDRHDYAGQLVALVRQYGCNGSRWVSAVPMAHTSTLERRITAMLNPRIDRSAPSRRATVMLAALLLLVALPAAAVRARQAGPAPLSGRIYDVTGGVLPGVKVTLVDANQATAAATTDATGRFEFASIAPGKYVLEAARPGFRPLRHEFELRDPGDWNRAVTLQVSALQETITIRETRVTAPGQQDLTALDAQRVRVGGNIRPPLKVKDVRPTYPASMLQAGLTGVVPVEAIIGRDGTVTFVRVLSAQIHPEFAIAAVDAVRQWRFTPTLLNGEPVEVVMTVSVRFDLEG